MDAIHHVPFDSLKCVHVIMDTFSPFVYALVLSVEKAMYAIRALKSDIVVIGVPWELKTDNGPVYTSQKFNVFLGS